MITTTGVTVTITTNTTKRWRHARLGLGAAGVLMALLAAPSALADQDQPTLAPGDGAAQSTETVQLASAEPTVAVASAGPTVAADLPTGLLAASATPAAAPQQPTVVQHLPSPDNLPPGTTTDAPPQGKMDYLHYLWNAVRTQEVTPSNAWLLLAQRPMSASAKPPSGVATGPSGPVGSSAPAEASTPVATDTQ